MAYAYPDMGQLYPTEGAFKTPGNYGAFLAAEGLKKANYLSEVDQWFSALEQQEKEFARTLGFKEKELTSREKLTREEFDLRRELQKEQLDYNRWMIEQTTESQEKIAGMRNLEPTYLGGPSRQDIFEAAQENFKMMYGRNYSNRSTSGDRFYTVSPSGTVVPATAGSMYSQVGSAQPYSSNYGQGGSPTVSGVSNYSDLQDLEW